MVKRYELRATAKSDSRGFRELADCTCGRSAQARKRFRPSGAWLGSRSDSARQVHAWNQEGAAVGARETKFALTENRVLFNRLRLTRKGEPCVELMFAWAKRTHGRDVFARATAQRWHGDHLPV